MDEAIDGASASVRWGVRVELRLRLGLCLLSSQDRGHRPYRLPSIRALADSAGVHRNTVAAVYRDLERFGLVRCVQGSGTFPLPAPDPRRLLTEPVQMASDLGDVLLTELEGELRRRPHPPPGRRREPAGPGPLLLPLDVTPPDDRRVVPVAPRGTALARIARLRPGSNLRLVSRSSSVARLVRHTLWALHGNTVGMKRVERLPPEAPPGVPDPPHRDLPPDVGLRRSARVTWDLTLVDAHQERLMASVRGTSDRRGAFLPLSLLARGDRGGG